MIEFLKNKQIFFLVFLVSFLVSCSGEKPISIPTNDNIQETQDCIKTVKYRSYGNVNVCSESFIKLQNIGDKSVFGAWYDKDNQYMLIQLKTTNYHYCGLSASGWSGIENANDADEYYISHIKGRYDCRNGFIPKY